MQPHDAGEGGRVAAIDEARFSELIASGPAEPVFAAVFEQRVQAGDNIGVLWPVGGVIECDDAVAVDLGYDAIG